MRIAKVDLLSGKILDFTVSVYLVAMLYCATCEPYKWNGKPKIIGGVDATVREFPFMLSLQMNPVFGRRYHFCGASILNETHVVTSAECLVGRVHDQIDIVAGAYNLTFDSDDEDSFVQHRSISSIIIHPRFDSTTLRYDIARITLNQSLQFSPHVQPMPFPPHEFSYTGSCTVIGWGTTLRPPSDSHTVQLLQKINMTLVTSELCQSIYEFIHDEFDNTTMICAKGTRDDKTQGPCSGDAGGPLICQGQNNAEVVAGIMSWSMIPCGNPSYPSIYTNVRLLSAITEGYYKI